ncbi:alpha-ketoglutarate-dependent dioxygenase alkB homolog 6 isoform X2 [Sesamum indicum]|uniref:Alpha-ketoglutarate-dependent dioxygenase alkB homolog 6 isoform X2 n=1 Tax=Sesamum indicum TaxID=4182 RepID=A0A6I9TSX7_SESIN|nr:alpha-ketoglutarate-dependent dioxygenase alkB homolog 6 isoform X2 [Sesamum indicum]
MCVTQSISLYCFCSDFRITGEVPPWLKLVTNRIYEESRLFPSAINHVLINEYLPDQGIMPHQDGPAYVPVVAILSLGSPVVMDFVPHPSFCGTATDISGNNGEDIISKPDNIKMSSGEYLSEYRPFSVALMPRSLLIFKDKAYSDFLHGIKDCEFQRFDEAVNVTNCLKSEAQLAHTISGLKIDGEAGDNVIHRTGTRVSLTCRVVTKVHKHLIKL